MWSDIDRVYLVEETPTEISSLPRTLEKLKASRYFAGYSPSEWHIVQVDKDEKIQIKSWLLWASIVALSSVGDSLLIDLEEIGLTHKWRSSEERKSVYKNPLLAVLLELRNYEVHIEFRPGELRNFSAWLAHDANPNKETEQKDMGDAFFFSPIDYQSLSRLRNLQSGRSNVTAEMTEWFNRQTSAWPAAYLIGIARELYTKYIANFIRQNGG